MVSTARIDALVGVVDVRSEEERVYSALGAKPDHLLIFGVAAVVTLLHPNTAATCINSRERSLREVRGP